MQRLPRLQEGCYYHIYNRGNNQADLFYEPRKYRYFLEQYTKYIEPVADTFAYCLLTNHFHLLVRIKTAEEQPLDPPRDATQQFANFFNSYTKSINKAYHRTGSLFQKRFGRIEVTSERYFGTLVRYIHQNPQKHGFVDDFRTYPYSSYGSLLSQQPTRLRRDTVLAWFGGAASLAAAHQENVIAENIEGIIDADFETLFYKRDLPGFRKPGRSLTR